MLNCPVLDVVAPAGVGAPVPVDVNVMVLPLTPAEVSVLVSLPVMVMVVPHGEFAMLSKLRAVTILSTCIDTVFSSYIDGSPLSVALNVTV